MRFPSWINKTSFSEALPLLGMTKDGATFTKGKIGCRVIEVKGRDYSGLSEAELLNLYNRRSNFFKTIPDDIEVLVQTHRRQKTVHSKPQNFGSPMASEIAQRWEKTYEKCYETKHYVCLVTCEGSIEENLLAFAGHESVDGSAKSTLDECAKKALKSLENFFPREVLGDELASYWGSLVNGREVFLKAPEDGFFQDFLVGGSLEFPRKGKYQIYKGATERYSGWLTFETPATGTAQRLIEILCEAKEEFSIYQSFRRFAKHDAIRYCEKRLRNLFDFSTYTEDAQYELKELLSRLRSDEVHLFKFRFAIEVFGDTPENLDISIQKIAHILEGQEFLTRREFVNIEASYWGRFPEKTTLNPRGKEITSQNAAHLAPFPRMGEGLSQCTWGKEPVCYFLTPTDSMYGFTWHLDKEEGALGHTVIVGGSGSGKTTLASFLLSMCQRYPNFKSVQFDSLHGMEIATNFMDGQFIPFAGTEKIGMNPFLLPDTPTNREFLIRFLSMLAPAKKDYFEREGNNILTSIYDLAPEIRQLTRFQDLFGMIDDRDSAAFALKKWFDGETYGHFFNHDKDVLSFNNPFITFDMTLLLSNEDVLGPVSFYIFHRIFEALKSDDGFAIFIDELPKYLSNSVFSPQVKVLLREIRKKEGVFIGASQDMKSVLESSIANAFLPNVATWILHQDSSAEWEDYEPLKLTKKEFEWVREETGERQVLVKRKTGESAILNTDLSSLGEMLKIFNSSNKEINRLTTIQSQYKEGWKHAYLYS